MESLTATLEDGSVVVFDRIDIRFVASGVQIGSRAAILEIAVPEFVDSATETYGEYRPVQTTTPTYDDAFDYCVFVDLHSYRHAPERNTMVFRDVGVMFFCGSEQLQLTDLQARALKMVDWSDCREYTSEEY